MSIGSVGANAPGGLSQLLAQMLSRLDKSKSTTNDDASSTSTAAGGASPASTASGSGGSNALTGTGQSGLSADIMSVLVQMQQQSAGTASAAPADAKPADPIQQLFTAMDSDGSGTVSQSEMETYVQKQGGMAQQADTLYASLDQNDPGAGGLTKDQLADGVQKSHGRHGHHHVGSGSQTASDAASQIFDALDTDRNGTVSADELAAAFSGNDSNAASNTANANSFGQIDGNGDGAIGKDEFSSFFAALSQQLDADKGTMGALMGSGIRAYQSAASLGQTVQA